MSAADASQGWAGGGFFRRNRNEIGLVIATIVVVVVTMFFNSSYADNPVENTQKILRVTALLGIFAFGAATVIIAGGIDLSAGSVIAFSGMLFAGIIVLLAPKSERGLPVTTDLPVWLIAAAVAGTLVTAILIGTFHTWLITIVRLPPFVATLASLVGLRSLAKVLVQNITAISHKQPKSTITLDNEWLLAVGQKGGWWVPVAIWFGLAIILWLLMGRTVVGRHLYAMGGNEQAAKLSGIQTDRLKWLAYCISTVTAAIAGILYTCYIGTADPSRDGTGYELNAIAASVVGGCSLAGGIGTVSGVMLGALFLRVVIDSVEKSFSSRPDLFEGQVVGGLVVLAVAFNELRNTSGWRRPFFPGILGWISLAILTALAGIITGVTSSEEKLRNGLVVGGVVFVLLLAQAI
jgi:ribose/xylose/arabinose/galactoside ABC-type transport system permease subunit